jgi:glyoxylase-like metal-dependent hydrolase (beta-lactamase superfamily II)
VRPDASTRDNWTEPGTFEVAPGIYRIPLPLPNDGLRAVNVYALTDGDDLMLIDSGWAIADARDVLDRGLDALGASARDVRRILVTHVHRDHYTQAVYLRREFGTRVGLGAGERSRSRSPWTRTGRRCRTSSTTSGCSAQVISPTR